MPCGGRHACGKCMVYAEGSFAAPSETEQKLLGAERLAQGIRLACFLEAVPDGKIDALRQEADGDETICVSTPSAEAGPRCAALPSSRRGSGYRYNDNCRCPLSGRQGCRNDWGHGIRSPYSERMLLAGWKLLWREKRINLRQSSGRQCRTCLQSWRNTQENVKRPLRQLSLPEIRRCCIS